ncbi:MAG TPA: T9SS type A sorting domain-containing protein [Candidatus Kapabacteria bacterium]|nr:T9SS type A sorting domain-containing protein [Candidatus Kapabacteria bacterium]
MRYLLVLGSFFLFALPANSQIVWKRLGNATAASIYVHQYDSIYVASISSGISSFDRDGELLWNSMTNGHSLDGQRTVVVNDAGHILYGASDGVWRSTDGGTKFYVSDAGMGVIGDDVQRLFRAKNNTIFAASFGVWRSTNGGANWAQANNGIDHRGMEALAMDSTGRVYAGSDGGAYRSSNNGGSWSKIYSAPIELLVRSIVAFNGTVVLGTNQGIIVSRDDGESWQPVTHELAKRHIRSLAYTFEGNLVIAATQGQGLIASMDLQTWYPFMEEGTTTHFTQDVVIDGSNIFIAGVDGAYMSFLPMGVAEDDERIERPLAYPNPFNSTLALDAGAAAVSQLFIIDAMGRSMWQGTSATAQVNTMQWPAGAYFLRSLDGRIVSSLIKQ